MEKVHPRYYFDLETCQFESLFNGIDQVWESLDRIKPYITERIQPNLGPLKKRYPDLVEKTVVLHEGKLYESGAFELHPGDTTKGQFGVYIEGEWADEAVVIYGGACIPADDVELQAGVVVESGALIKGPTIIGPRTEIRQGAYVRGSVLAAGCAVIGHSTEVKNAVFLYEAKAGHFAYVGDSVLGRDCNLGAGTKLANLKIIPTPTKYHIDGRDYTVTRRKFGAIVGDRVQLGCNTVTNPGAMLGPRCLISPNSTVKADFHPRGTVLRGDETA